MFFSHWPSHFFQSFADIPRIQMKKEIKNIEINLAEILANKSRATLKINLLFFDATENPT